METIRVSEEGKRILIRVLEERYAVLVALPVGTLTSDQLDEKIFLRSFIENQK